MGAFSVVEAKTKIITSEVCDEEELLARYKSTFKNFRLVSIRKEPEDYNSNFKPAYTYTVVFYHETQLSIL